ncbi:MAG: hypothetical protein D3910_20780 [Candidatus Electrothrix sp. ATG2]|nr:hypothetical protein [Candidatus Electrothrix sp. ATG2]
MLEKKERKNKKKVKKGRSVRLDAFGIKKKGEHAEHAPAIVVSTDSVIRFCISLQYPPPFPTLFFTTMSVLLT